MQDVLERQLTHGRQIKSLLNPPYPFENLEREFGIIHAISDDFSRILLPFFVDSESLQLMLALAKELFRHIVKRFLLGSHLRLNSPPDIGQNPSIQTPEPLP